jgi:hypothetical protein
MDFNLKIEVLEYWMDHWSEIKKVPSHLTEKMTIKEAQILFDSIGRSGGKNGREAKVHLSDMSDYIDRMINRQKIKLEMESIEFNKEILEKQTKIQETSQETLAEQSNVLKNTFWVYSIMTLVLFSQLVLSFLDSQLNVSRFTVMLSFLLVLVSGYFMFYLRTHMVGIKLKKNIWLLNVAIILVLILIVVFVGYNYGSFSTQDQLLVVTGSVNVTNLIA